MLPMKSLATCFNIRKTHDVIVEGVFFDIHQRRKMDDDKVVEQKYLNNKLSQQMSFNFLCAGFRSKELVVVSL